MVSPDYWLSVVTVVRNDESALEQTLDNVSDQTADGFEHLIIDGASTDRTLEIARSRARVDPRVRVVSEPDSGIYDAMNKAISLARGQYIHYLNAGDVYVDRSSLSDLGPLLREQAPPWFRTPVHFVDQNGEPSRPTRSAELDVTRFVNGRQPVYHQGAIMTRELLAEFNGFDLQYSISADYDLMRRILVAGVCPKTDETVLVYVDDAGVSTQQWPRALLDVHRSRTSVGGRAAYVRSLGVTAGAMVTVASKRSVRKGARTVLGTQRAERLRRQVQGVERQD